MRKILLLILITPLLIFFPQIASITFAKGLTEYLFEKKWGGQVEIDMISLHWFEPQELKGICWNIPTSSVEYTFEQVDWNASLFQLKTPSSASFQGGMIALKKGKWAMRFPLMEVSIVNGLITIPKTRLFVGSEIEAWVMGTINPSNTHLDMILGIPGKNLASILKIKELSTDLIIEVPLSCKLNHSSIAKLSAKIQKLACP